MSATPMPRNSNPRVGDLLGHLQVRVEGKRKSDDSANEDPHSNIDPDDPRQTNMAGLSATRRTPTRSGTLCDRQQELRPSGPFSPFPRGRILSPIRTIGETRRLHSQPGPATFNDPEVRLWEMRC
jgi:hypothetical protein